MPYPETAEAFCVTDVKKWSDFTKMEVKLKPFGDRDIDVAIDACGVCSSDVHRITGGWGTDFPLPLCVGHEIIGRAIRVGKDVTTIKVGDRVGVGAQVGADLTCDLCQAEQENYCPQQIDTYAGIYPDGTVAQGGYSSHIRAHEHFTFKIPDNIETSIAAPMLCAGLTVYSPLVRLGVGPGKRVAIVGIGGLGHFGILFAKALGAEVYAISHSPKKEEDALKLGATGFINTGKEGWAKPYTYKFDVIICCADVTDQFHLPDYFNTLKPNGHFINSGFPNNPLPPIRVQDLGFNGCFVGANHLGNRREMISMLELASKLEIKSWVETIDISEAGCKEAVERVYNGDRVRYRFTLVGYDKVFGKRE